MSQLIISVGREFGSAGRAIAEELSKRFNTTDTLSLILLKRPDLLPNRWKSTTRLQS